MEEKEVQEEESGKDSLIGFSSLLSPNFYDLFPDGDHPVDLAKKGPTFYKNDSLISLPCYILTETFE